jgi:hypothetical protein
VAATLVKETGAGLSNSNAYEDVDGADAYHEAHAYASAWTGSDAVKTVALIHGARLIDQHFDFDGYKASASQALQWPRCEVYDPDTEGDLLASDEIPTWLRQANAEMARHLLASTDRTADQYKGLDSLQVDVIRLNFSKYDRAGVLPDSVVAFLRRYGSAGGGNSVALVR